MITSKNLRMRLASLPVVVFLCAVSACTNPVSEAVGEEASHAPDGGGAAFGDDRPLEGPNATATVTTSVDRVLSGDESFPDGFVIPAGEVWSFDSETSTIVESGGNVVVHGVLRMHPEDYDVMHTLRFVGVDESAFGGGGMEVLDTDVGLWVVGDGQLDIVGSPRAGWNRTGTDPTWQPGDEILVAPNAMGDSVTFRDFEPGSEVPTVSYAGETYSTEVLNLTRNVRIEGTGDGEASPATNGRAHIWVNSSQPQTIKYAALRHLGPRRMSDDNPTQGVFSRYPLHFHKAGDGVRGSLVEGVVVRDSGNHAFVAHSSHGVTFRDSIAFNVFGDAYWWDPDATGHGGPAPNATNDLLIDHAMAAYVRFDPAFRGYTLTGFLLGEGKNLTITDSVAVGIQGNKTASGFHWPATANGNEQNVWDFKDNVAHNNRTSGIFVWQNDDNDHLVESFVGYRNGAFGVDHGAYGNRYRYDGLVLFENGESGIRSKATSIGGQRWSNIDTDGLLIGERSASSDSPVVFENMTIRGPIVVDEGDEASAYEFRNVRTADGDELSRDDFDVRRQVSTITVFLSDGTSFQL